MRITDKHILSTALVTVKPVSQYRLRLFPEDQPYKKQNIPLIKQTGNSRSLFCNTRLFISCNRIIYSVILFISSLLVAPNKKATSSQKDVAFFIAGDPVNAVMVVLITLYLEGYFYGNN